MLQSRSFLANLIPADGCLAQPDGDEPNSSTTESNTPANLVKRIPKRIVQNAAGIAIFTCMRSGLWMTGSGGSGILIARKSDGTWSPPSALLLHTPTLSFIMGVDVYDCVLVINNLSALESIVQPQVTLGEDVGLSGGPMLPHGSGEEDIRWKDLGNTVLTYLKAKGQVQHANLSGCMLTERANENERFYGSNATMMDILAGNVFKNVEETRPLFEVIKQAEGRTDFDAGIIDKLSTQCAPGDALIESPSSTPPLSPSRPKSAFGVPNAHDPDPFGVLALEMAGLEIKEAGSHVRPTSSQFEYAPSPTSPLFPRFQRRSVDTMASRSNRGSCLSVRTEQTHATDVGTQTSPSNTPHTTPSLSQSEDGRDRHSLEKTNGLEDVAEEEVDYTKIDFRPIEQLNNVSLDGATVVESPSVTDEDRQTERDVSSDDTKPSSAPTSPDATPVLKAEDDGEDADDEDEEEEDEEPVVVYEVASAIQPVRTAAAVRPQHAKGAIVNIPKRVPPPLPLRNPARGSRASKSEFGDTSSLETPGRSSFASETLGTPMRDSFASEVQSGGECDAKTPVVAERQAPETQAPETPVAEAIEDKGAPEPLAAPANDVLAEGQVDAAPEAASSGKSAGEGRVNPEGTVAPADETVLQDPAEGSEDVVAEKVGPQLTAVHAVNEGITA